MMRDVHVISEKSLLSFLDRLMGDLPVIAPVRRRNHPGFFRFERLERATDLAADYTATTLPPKAAFFPPKETLFSFDADGTPLARAEDDQERTPFVLFGVHPCDLAAIEALDSAYGFPPAEKRWSEQRKRAVVVGMECRPDSYCFCASMGTAEARAPADMFLTPISDGYLAETHSPMGRVLVSDAGGQQASVAQYREALRIRRRKTESMTAALDISVSQLADVLEQGGLTGLWRQVADRCYSCGSCNTTCPTCFCFAVGDSDHAGPATGGHRQRWWDSCQLLDFARVAGGHNFRKERWQRVRHRWHRKFLYLYRRFGRPFCTGCGRCSRACTADINIVEVTNQLAAHYLRERTS